MTGWNLPPGCSVSDLPGNTWRDVLAEYLCETCPCLLQCDKNDTFYLCPIFPIYEYSVAEELIGYE